MNLAIRAVAGLLAFGLALPAQSALQDWNNLKALAAGSDVRVEAGGRTTRGKWQGATDDALTIDAGRGPEMLARAQVTAVAVRGKSHRVRNAVIGLAIGAGAGAGIGAATVGSCTGFCISPITRGQAAGIAAGALGALGALIGAVIPPGWHQAYAR